MVVSRSRSRDCRRTVDECREATNEIDDERSYWARKKAEKVSKLWEKLHAEGSASRNALDRSREESDDDDDVKAVEAKVSMSPERNSKKHKKHKKLKKHKKRLKRDKSAKKQ